VPVAEALVEIRQQAGQQFDPQVVEVFCAVLAEGTLANTALPASPPAPLAKPVILIVDDEENITRSLTRSLRDQFTVLTANSGADALAILGQHPVNVILTDQRMPELSGVALLQRASQLQPLACGVLLSAYSDNPALETALNLGTVWGYIRKPWDTEMLRSRLSAIVRHQSMVPAGWLHDPHAAAAAYTATALLSRSAGL
jgi:response regulator RpfG family c-di-GMP phosphodiesterase